MDFYQAVETRQSCRAYADRPVEKEAVLRILRAARLSPSACNSQPWTFVVADDPALCAKVSDCLQSGRLGINRWIRDNMVEGSNKELVFMLYPGGRGEDAYMTVETDQPVTDDMLRMIRALCPALQRVFAV